MKARNFKETSVIIAPARVSEIIRKFVVEKSKYYYICNESYKLLGVVSQSDLLMSVLLNKIDEDVMVIMNPNFIFIERSSMEDTNQNIFFDKGLTEVPVLSTSGELLDVKSIFDYDCFK